MYGLNTALLVFSPVHVIASIGLFLFANIIDRHITRSSSTVAPIQTDIPITVTYNSQRTFSEGRSPIPDDPPAYCSVVSTSDMEKYGFLPPPSYETATASSQQSVNETAL